MAEFGDDLKVIYKRLIHEYEIFGRKIITIDVAVPQSIISDYFFAVITRMARNQFNFKKLKKNHYQYS